MYGSKIPDVMGIHDYASALACWEKTKPWRGDRDTNIRPIEPTRKRYMNIRRGDNGSVICRLYDTDVVTWHPNGYQVEVTPYPSKLTDAFAALLLPNDIWPRFASTMWTCLEVHSVVYQIDDDRPTVLEKRNGEWMITSDTTTPFEKTVVDQKITRQLLRETNYADFRDWLTATRVCGLPSGDLGSWHWNSMKPLELLADRSKWMVFARFDMTTSTILARVRQAIYDAAVGRRCTDGTMVETTRTVYLDSVALGDLHNLRRAQLKDRSVQRARGLEIQMSKCFPVLPLFTRQQLRVAAGIIGRRLSDRKIVAALEAELIVPMHDHLEFVHARNMHVPYIAWRLLHELRGYGHE